jgi:hypothetical protein
MNKVKCMAYLDEFKLTQKEASILLGVTPRAFNRWLKENLVPRSVECVFKAWLRLKQNNWSWRPDEINFYDLDRMPDSSDARKAEFMHAKPKYFEEAVKNMGDLAAWKVELNFTGGNAKLEGITLNFIRKNDDTIYPNFYRNSIVNPDLEIHRELLEGAMYCIYREIKNKGWPK